jgi:integrase
MAKRKNGLGSITRLEDGRYRMRKQMGVLANGRPRILTVTGTSETSCLKKMRVRENELAIVQATNELKKLTLAEFCRMHLDDHLSQKGRLKPKSADRRESTINNQIVGYPIGEKIVEAVTQHDVANHIQLLINGGELSTSSIRKALDVINAAFKWGIDKEYLTYNPVRPVYDELRSRLKIMYKKELAESVVKILSDAQADELIKYADFVVSNSSKRYKSILALGLVFVLYTGMRIGELCALRWKDWDSEKHILNIRATRNVVKNRTPGGKKSRENENGVKNEWPRVIELSEEANETLEKMFDITPLKQGSDYVIFNNAFRPNNPTHVDRFIKGYYREIGFPEDISGAHILRRTYATKLYNEGCPIEEIAKYLGDLPETVRKHYINITKRLEQDGKIINVIRIPKKK